MAYLGDQKSYPSELEQNIEIKPTTGGKATNPLWKSEIDNESLQATLEKSLDQQGLLSATGDYQLNVILLETDQPIFGLNFKVTTVIQYVITEVSNGTVVFDEPITAQFTATMDDAFVAVKRLRLANEGSIRANIELFLDRLSKMDNEIRLTMHIITGALSSKTASTDNSSNSSLSVVLDEDVPSEFLESLHPL